MSLAARQDPSGLNLDATTYGGNRQYDLLPGAQKRWGLLGGMGMNPADPYYQMRQNQARAQQYQSRQDQAGAYDLARQQALGGTTPQQQALQDAQGQQNRMLGTVAANTGGGARGFASATNQAAGGLGQNAPVQQQQQNVQRAQDQLAGQAMMQQIANQQRQQEGQFMGQELEDSAARAQGGMDWQAIRDQAGLLGAGYGQRADLGMMGLAGNAADLNQQYMLQQQQLARQGYGALIQGAGAGASFLSDETAKEEAMALGYQKGYNLAQKKAFQEGVWASQGKGADGQELKSTDDIEAWKVAALKNPPPGTPKQGSPSAAQQLFSMTSPAAGLALALQDNTLPNAPPSPKGRSNTQTDALGRVTQVSGFGGQVQPNTQFTVYGDQGSPGAAPVTAGSTGVRSAAGGNLVAGPDVMAARGGPDAIAEGNLPVPLSVPIGKAKIPFPTAFLSDETQKTAKQSLAAQDFLEALESNAGTYRYKDAAKAPGGHDGRFLGIYAQGLERVPEIGKSLVKDTPQGKMVNSHAMLGAVGASLGQIHKRLKKLEE